MPCGSQKYRYRVEFRHKNDDFWDMPSSRVVNARNQREAIRKFKSGRNAKNMVIEGATREPRKRKNGTWGW
jgi:hypothetical protein